MIKAAWGRLPGKEKLWVSKIEESGTYSVLCRWSHYLNGKHFCSWRMDLKFQGMFQFIEHGNFLKRDGSRIREKLCFCVITLKSGLKLFWTKIMFTRINWNFNPKKKFWINCNDSNLTKFKLGIHSGVTIVVGCNLSNLPI